MKQRARTWGAVVVSSALLTAACTGRDAVDDPPPGLNVDDPTAEANTFEGLDSDRRVSVDGDERIYDAYVPRGHWDAADDAALVLLLHGQRGSRADMLGTSRAIAPYEQWQRVADEHNLVLVVPAGARGSNGHTGWNDCRSDASGNPTTDDVAFLTTAIDDVAATYRIDDERVFAVGTSNGAHMSIRLALEVPERITGFAAIAAGMPVNSSCDDLGTPTSALFMWGTADPIAPFDGGAMASNRGDILSAGESLRFWTDRNQTSPNAVATTFPDLDAGDDSTVDQLLYTDGVDGTRVALFTVAGGGHTEPSIEAQYRRLFLRIVGNQNHDIEMANEVWSFFDSN